MLRNRSQFTLGGNITNGDRNEGHRLKEKISKEASEKIYHRRKMFSSSKVLGRYLENKTKYNNRDNNSKYITDQRQLQSYKNKRHLSGRWASEGREKDAMLKSPQPPLECRPVLAPRSLPACLYCLHRPVSHRYMRNIHTLTHTPAREGARE